MAVTSPDFQTGARLGEENSADGANLPPRIAVVGVPSGAIELALIVHDPDAPVPRGFTHWVRYGLAPVEGEIASEAGRPGPNAIGARAWYGPQPPVGHGDHHYYFWVYALDVPVEGEPTREEFLDGYAGNILAQARIVGVFSR
ncbi:MAG: YbhB/YbcL family Raf kinase inhibitor-like protein [Microbacterium sp.]